MSGKLDQSLDEIMKDSKPTGGRRNTRQPRGRKPAAVAAPIGGIQKKGNAKSVAQNTSKKTATAVAAVIGGDSKIAISNLPEDVTERQIKDFFLQAVGPVKRVIVNYGPTGRSRGSATVLFNQPGGAALAAKLDGTAVDGKPLRIEVLVTAQNVSAKPAKSLQERITKPKQAAQDKPKSAVKSAMEGVTTTNGKKKNAKDAQGAGKGKKPARNGKPKKKTTEELDAEMQDYFGQPNGANGTTQAAATANGDTMDEVL